MTEGASGIIDGRKPYVMLDETSTASGATRLRALALLPVTCFLLGALVLTYELSGTVGDRDARDLAWDYRVTLSASAAWHAHFRQASWGSYGALLDPSDVFDEVVIAAADRPVVLGLMGGTSTCQRVVTVPCLATKPEHRDNAAGALNLGSDAGVWAVGNGRAFKRNATFSGLLPDGLASVPTKYPDPASLAAAAATNLAELLEMRRAAGVPSPTGNGLSCAADATGRTCTWTQSQWSTWATVTYATLGATDCETAVDVCAQTDAALRLAVQDSSNAGRVAVRVVTGTWTRDNVHLKHLASVLPAVRVVSDNGTHSLSAQAATALNWFPRTDVASDNTSWVDPSIAAAFVAAARDTAKSTGVGVTGYVAPPDADTRYHGFRGGVVVNGARATLATSFETSSDWSTTKGFTLGVPEFWPWKSTCAGTAHNVTVLTDASLSVPSFPAFDARGDAPTVAVTVLGTTTATPAYSSRCDFDGATAGAALTCAVGVLTSLTVEVVFAPVAGEEFGAWRVAGVTPGYGAEGDAASEYFAGTEAEAVKTFAANATRLIRVTLRDAGAPEAFATPALGTGRSMIAVIGLFAAGMLTLPAYPFLMTYVVYNVAVNNGKPPPGWREMVQYRGW